MKPSAPPNCVERRLNWPGWRTIAGSVLIVMLVVCCSLAIAKPHAHTVYPIYSYAAQAWHDGGELYVCVPKFDFYRYSPTFAALFQVLLPLGDGWGSVVWRMVGAQLLIWALMRWMRSIWQTVTPGRIGLVILLVVPFLFQNLHNGQANVHLLALLLLGAADAAEGRCWRSAGWFAAAVLIKPYSIAVAGLVGLCESRLWSRLTAALVLGMGLAFFFQSPSYVAEQHIEWFRHFCGNDRSTGELRNQYRDVNLLFRVYATQMPARIYTVLIALAGFALAGIVWARKLPVSTGFALGCCWITVLGPATESCTYLLLAPTLAAALLDRPGRSGFWLRVAYAMYFGTICASIFPNDWQIQVVGPQPIAGLIVVYVLVRDAMRREREVAMPLRMAA